MIQTAVILAGGEGTRLRPVTYEIPKPLVPVQGKAIATWLVRLFAEHGVKEVIVTIPPKWKHAFEAWREACLAMLDSAQQIEIELWEEHEPMGTMGALVHHLGERVGMDPVLVTNGDELKAVDLHQLETFHREQKNHDPQYSATIALLSVPNPQEYGVAEMEGDRIVRFHEKPAEPPSSFISSGLYVIEPQMFAEVDRDKKFLMFEKDMWPRLALGNRLGGCKLDGQWFDCGTLERWETAIKEWRG
ncbi:MAG: nucleotidyltransferase family protein [Patescibacteria group bacterium]